MTTPSGGGATALRAEWVKRRTLPETWWLTAGAVALAVAASAAMVATTHVSPGAPGGGPDPTKLALTGLDLAQAVLSVLAVVTITDEYATGMIRVTVAAIPRREAMLGAKAIRVVGLSLAAAVAAVATGAVLALLYLPPLLALLVSGPWRRHIEQLAPMTAGLSIEATRHLRAVPDAPWTGLAILAAWAAGALLLAVAALRMRDV